MAFESVFRTQFDKAADKALSTGVELQQANVMDCSLLVGIHNLYF
jgi:hypothetical protein